MNFDYGSANLVPSFVCFASSGISYLLTAPYAVADAPRYGLGAHETFTLNRRE